MSDYCDCCTNNLAHIRQHYDPGALTEVNEKPEEVLELFRKCFPREGCPLKLRDVQDYIESLGKEA